MSFSAANAASSAGADVLVSSSPYYASARDVAVLLESAAADRKAGR